MKESYWEKKMREKFSFLYPSENIPRIIGKHIVIIIMITFFTLVGMYTVGAVTLDRVFYTEFGQKQSENVSSVIDLQTGEVDNEKFKEYLRTSGTDFVLSKESDFPTYEDFLKDLEKTCPYYEPDGVSYRECLYNLLEEKDKKAISVSSDLVKDVGIVISEKKMNPDGIDFDTAYFGEQYFLASFAELRKSWGSYRDGLCEADHATSFAGSNTSGFVMTCKLYETEKYILKLIGYRYSWVHTAVQYYFDNGIHPQTSEFRALTEKERNFGSF